MSDSELTYEGWLLNRNFREVDPPRLRCKAAHEPNSLGRLVKRHCRPSGLLWKPIEELDHGTGMHTRIHQHYRVLSKDNYLIDTCDVLIAQP